MEDREKREKTSLSFHHTCLCFKGIRPPDERRERKTTEKNFYYRKFKPKEEGSSLFAYSYTQMTTCPLACYSSSLNTSSLSLEKKEMGGFSPPFQRLHQKHEIKDSPLGCIDRRVNIHTHTYMRMHTYQTDSKHRQKTPGGRPYTAAYRRTTPSRLIGLSVSLYIYLSIELFVCVY